MRISIVTTHVPFVKGGAERHAENLRDALEAQGYDAEIVRIPFKWYPPEKILDAMLACRLIDLTEAGGQAIDLVIGLKFPAYLVPHPNKVLWILHQHRTAYDLWDSPFNDLIGFPNGREVRQAIIRADKKLLREAKAIYANSRNVSSRLEKYCGLKSTPLYHPPPNAECFWCSEAGNYVYFPSRIDRLKRQDLVLSALTCCESPVEVWFSGYMGDATYYEELMVMTRRLKLENRVKWLGEVSESQKVELYARALGIIYPPIDEDYGYVTLEAMLSAKPVITCFDSGGPLEFVIDGESGLIVEPSPESLSVAVDSLWKNRKEAVRWGKAGKQLYKELEISWPKVVKKLLG